MCSSGIRITLACALAIAGIEGIGAGPLRAEQGLHPAKPLLWKIEGRGLEKPSYLFGTIHLGGGPLANLHPAAAKAFDAADFLYTEVPFDPAAEVAMVAGMIRKDGKTLTASIGPELAAKLNAELKLISPELDVTPFDPLKTWVVAIALPMLPSQMKGGKPMDAMLWDRAVAAGKETGSIEKSEDQTGIFDALTEEEQVITLSEVIRVIREDRDNGRDSVEDLVAAYVSGDLEAIRAELEKSLKSLAESGHKELGERLMKQLLPDRDVTMAASIHGSLQENPAKCRFFAAGAGHFAADTSIRSHLADKGYTITAITE